jgi:hypothetical protein
MVMSVNLGLVIMGIRRRDLASNELTLPDRHSRPTATMLATAIERLYLPPFLPLQSIFFSGS